MIFDAFFTRLTTTRSAGFEPRSEIGPGPFAQGFLGLPVHMALLFSGNAAQIVAPSPISSVTLEIE